MNIITDDRTGRVYVVPTTEEDAASTYSAYECAHSKQHTIKGDVLCLTCGAIYDEDMLDWYYKD